MFPVGAEKIVALLFSVCGGGCCSFYWVEELIPLLTATDFFGDILFGLLSGFEMCIRVVLVNNNVYYDLRLTSL